MEIQGKYVHLRPRLQLVHALIHPADTIADIGCDHGRLSIALLQSGKAGQVIASDISEASLEKARWLAGVVGVSSRVSFRVGSGLAVLRAQEAGGIAICGMGGALIAQLLQATEYPLCGAKQVVLQPMRGVEKLRKYLRENGYRITADAIVLDAGRYYQVFSAEPGEERDIPAWWPHGCYFLGPHARHDPLFGALCQNMRTQCLARLSTATGTRGEHALCQKITQLDEIQLGLEQEDHA